MLSHNSDLAPYYIHIDILYSSHFPQTWAVEEHPSCGPNNCSRCREVGLWNGVFIGYCSECAIKHHHGKRGRGFIQPGFEARGEAVSIYPSVFDTYLFDVNLNDVGDKNIEDSQERIYNEILESQNEFMQSTDDLGNTCPDEYPFGSMEQRPTHSSFDGGYDSY